MEYIKGKQLTNPNQFVEGKWYYKEGELMQFSHLDDVNDPCFIDNGEGYAKNLSGCFPFEFIDLNYYEAIPKNEI